MNELSPFAAWQPLSFGGAAAFAHAPLRGVLTWALIVAALAAGSVIWLLTTGWAPVIQGAISRLPDQGEIRRGQLHGVNSEPVLLAENSFLSIAINLETGESFGKNADVQITFRETDAKLCWLFGCRTLRFPKNWTIAANRAELQPAWGAWKPLLLAIAGGLAFAFVLGWWVFLASALVLPVRAICFFIDRSASWPNCWRLCLAALMPGALFMTGAIVLYGLRQIHLVGLLIALPLHLLILIIYLSGAVGRLAPIQGAAIKPKNPFAGAAQAPAERNCSTKN